MKRLILLAWIIFPLFAAAQQHYPSYGSAAPGYVNGSTHATVSGARAVMEPLPPEPEPPSESKSLKFSFTTQDTVTYVTFTMGDWQQLNNFDFTVNWGDTTETQTLTMEAWSVFSHTYLYKASHTVTVEKISNESLDVAVDIAEIPLTSFTIDSESSALFLLRVMGCYLTESAISDLAMSIPERDESNPGIYCLAPQSELFKTVTQSQSADLALKGWECDGGCYVEPKSLKFSFSTQDTVTVVRFEMGDFNRQDDFTFMVDWGDTTAPQTLKTESENSTYTHEYEHPAAHTVLIQKTSSEGFGIAVHLSSQYITEFIPDALNCTALQLLEFTNCVSLTTQLNLTGFTSLQYLSLVGCASLQSLSLGGCTSLVNLGLADCASMTDLTLIGSTNLEYISMNGCISITEVTLSELTKLQTFDITGSKLLTDITLSGLTALQNLGLSGCTALTDVTISGLTALQILGINGCSLNESALTSVIGLLPDRTGLENAGIGYLIPQSEGFPATLTTEQQSGLDAKNWISY